VVVVVALESPIINPDVRGVGAGDRGRGRRVFVIEVQVPFLLNI